MYERSKTTKRARSKTGPRRSRHQGLQQGRHEGREEGHHQAILLVARRLLIEEGMSPQAVQRLTGLSEKEVMDLVDKH